MIKKLFRRLPPELQEAAIGAASKPEPTPPVARATPKPPQAARDRKKVQVLFLCIGNSCRSPMAEGLARHYGADVMWVQSAGLWPIHRVDPLGVKVMQDRNIDISEAYPKGADEVEPGSFDLIVNMSGQKLPSINVPVEEWNVPDPIGQDEEAFRKTADQLEHLVMRLILQLRLKQHPAVSDARPIAR